MEIGYTLENRLTVAGKFLDGSDYFDVIEDNVHFKEVMDRLIYVKLREIMEVHKEYVTEEWMKYYDDIVVDPLSVSFLIEVCIVNLREKGNG